jgi:NTE family protein
MMKSTCLSALEKKLPLAESYSEWKELALAHDKESGMEDWKHQQTTDLYDHHLIRSRLTLLRNLRLQGNDRKLLCTMNEGIHGNLGGMGKPALYRQAKFGTKTLINEYIEEVVSVLEDIAASSCPKIAFADKLDFFRRASHCFGRSALMLSGGATQGMFHMGVTKALFEQDLLPNVISGSSAGSIMASVLATHTDDELKALLSKEELKLEAMKFTGWKGVLKGIPLMDGEYLETALAEYVPDLTFEEGFQRSQRHVNISISPADPKHESRLLNAITSPNVYVRKGAMASCAVPGIFPPVTLSAKDPDGIRQAYNPSRQWIDGSFSNDLPGKRLSRLYGVNHFIASQINPHVVPFVSDKGARQGLRGLAADVTLKTAKQLVDTVLRVGRDKLKYPYVGYFLTQAHALVSQDYSADIVLYPNRRFSNPSKLFSNLNEADIAQLIDEGEKATWPKIEMIRNCTRISQTLDSILSRLEAEEHQRLNQSESA